MHCLGAALLDYVMFLLDLQMTIGKVRVLPPEPM